MDLTGVLKWWKRQKSHTFVSSYIRQAASQSRSVGDCYELDIPTVQTPSRFYNGCLDDLRDVLGVPTHRQGRDDASKS